ncbi:3-phosphoserine/phosphohydroxythreonine transaminase [Myxococcota bacterium]
MSRVINFNAGPAALPLAALERARDEMLDFVGTGMSVMEHSHRGKAYEAVHNEAIGLVRDLMGISNQYDVLLLQGGATQQFAVVPMNLLRSGQSADYIITGHWSQRALAEAKAVGSVRVAGTSEREGKFPRVAGQTDLSLDSDASYVHITSNNTIEGTQYHAFPDTGSVPLVADMSSDIMWGPLDVSRLGLIYAGAQKNLGPSGVTLVVVRKDLVEAGRTDIPSIFSYRTHVKNNSLFNTPSTFGIYMLRNVLAWLKQIGGLEAVQKNNRAKAELIYGAMAKRPDFYRSPVEAQSRSMMNVVFNLPTPELEEEFVRAAQKHGMVGLKGHRSVGGVRASIYNAVPLEGVRTLASFMQDFHQGA